MMPGSSRKDRAPLAERVMTGRRAAHIPHEFVIDALEPVHPWTRRMFGCTAVYADDRFLMILCDRENLPKDNGVWLGTSREHHASLRSDFPRMRSVAAFGIAVTAWQVLAQDDPEFEAMALHACALIKAGDPRIGKIPKPRVRKKGRKSPGRKSRVT
jgi:hypothetical protein